MTREKAKALLPIITAWVDGETIQIRNDDKTSWCDISHHVDLSFDCAPDRYRIKPKPREYWVNIYPNGEAVVAHPTKAEADTIALADRVQCIKVREVTE